MTIRITEMPYGQAEQILQFLAAGADLFAGAVRRDLGEIRVSQGVGTDFMAGGKPFTDLSRIHYRLRRFALGHIPFVAFSKEVCGQELDRFEPLTGQRVEAMAQHIDVTVVKSDDDFLPVVDSPKAPLEKPAVRSSCIWRSKSLLDT